MDQRQLAEEIDLKQLAKRTLKVFKNRRKSFTLLLAVIMLLSGAYFFKVIVKPSYISEVILKSRTIRKDQLSSILEKFNLAIKENDGSLSKDLESSLLRNNIVKFDVSEIKADITSPDKNDITKFYKLTTIYKEKPSSNYSKDAEFIINEIKQHASEDNDIKIGKLKTQLAIGELDTLLKVAISAGGIYKTKLESSTGMIVMDEMYRSLNDLLARKSTLINDAMYYEKENIIFRASPIVLKKNFSFPLIIFFIGLVIWILIVIGWIGAILIFGDDE